ncbi:MAG: hypothetical protein V1907_00080 [Candidatus Kerfeldbacteria bacterium]
MDFTPSLADIRDLVSSITTGLVAIIAIKGYGQWRQQIMGKSRYEVASALLTKIYKMQNEISFVRQPFVPIEEYPSKMSENASPEVYARSKRFSKLSNTFAEFEGKLFQARAVLGQTNLYDVENLRKHIQSLFKALWMYVHLFEDAKDDEKLKSYRDEHYKTLVDYDTEDVFRPEFDRLVTAIETKLSVYLK